MNMKRIIKTLGMLVMFLALSFVTQISAKAAHECDTPSFRTVNYSVNKDFVDFSVNGVDYKIPIGKAYEINQYSFDCYGTLWVVSDHQIFWSNFELEGANMSFHYLDEGTIVGKVINNVAEKYVSEYGGPDFFYPLPTPEELKVLLYKEQHPSTPTPIPTSTPRPKPAQVSQSPSSSNSPLPTFTPKQDTNVKYVKYVKYVGNKIKLIENEKTVRSVTFKKKTGVLTYKKKIKNVQAVFYTKKGTIVYLKKNKRIYYFNGKKSILIKKNVKKVFVDTNNFAFKLKLKNGHSFRLTK